MRASITHLGRLKPASSVPFRGYFASTSAIVAACFMEGWWYECLSLASSNFESVRLAGGRLGVGEALRCKIRHFTEGLVLGSVEFVEAHFQRDRRHFSTYRTRDSRPIECMAAFDLHSL